VVGGGGGRCDRIILSKALGRSIGDASDDGGSISDDVEAVEAMVVELSMRCRRKVDFLKVEVEIFVGFRLKIQAKNLIFRQNSPQHHQKGLQNRIILLLYTLISSLNFIL
jgi:hypothetical protein